jgi:hypothetical protein
MKSYFFAPKQEWRSGWCSAAELDALLRDHYVPALRAAMAKDSELFRLFYRGPVTGVVDGCARADILRKAGFREFIADAPDCGRGPVVIPVNLHTEAGVQVDLVSAFALAVSK